MDTFWWRRFGPYDSAGLNSTPNLSAYWAEGVALHTHFSSSNWTVPSFVSIFGGATNLDVGLVNYSAEVLMDMHNWPDWEYLPAVLADMEWTTCLIAGNNHLNVEELGFGSHGCVFNSQEGMLAVDVVERAEEELLHSEPLSEPWLFWAHFFDAHDPYEPPEEFRPANTTFNGWDLATDSGFEQLKGEWQTLSAEEQTNANTILDALYRGEIYYMDQEIGRFLSDLEAAHMLDRTFVVFLTDHGEQFGEHGALGHNRALFGEENKTIVFFWAKNLVTGCWDGQTTHADIAPTIFSLLGLEPPEAWTGIPAGQAPADRILSSQFFLDGLDPYAIAVTRDDGIKAQCDWKGNRWVTDLLKDPDETINLFNEEDPTTKEIWEEIERVAEEVQALEGIEPPPDLFLQ
jgi:arylsulfatase A-like enzyme